jgi:hypothetical protein
VDAAAEGEAMIAAAHLGRHIGGWGLIAIGVAIWVLWPIVAYHNWENVVQTHNRLGYFFCDMTIMAPLCLASGYGLVRDYRWGSAVLLLAIGAAAFDLAHTLIFMAQIQVPKIGGRALPWWAYALVVALVLVLLGLLAWREIEVIMGGSGTQGAGLYVTPAAMLVGALASGALASWFTRRAAQVRS